MLKGKKVVVTAGPTHEAIDPVRFIGNHSTGKMGYSIANLLAQKGAIVHLISGPSNLIPIDKVNIIRIKSAQEMYDAAAPLAKDADIIILAAAVADYRPKDVATSKIKKKDDTITLELVKNIDIAATIGKTKKANQLMVGFALETDNELENAKTKLKSKNLDFIVLNSLKNEGTCFGSDNNKITIIDNNNQYDFELKNKNEVATDIISFIEKKLG